MNRIHFWVGMVCVVLLAWLLAACVGGRTEATSTHTLTPVNGVPVTQPQQLTLVSVTPTPSATASPSRTEDEPISTATPRPSHRLVTANPASEYMYSPTPFGTPLPSSFGVPSLTPTEGPSPTSLQFNFQYDQLAPVTANNLSHLQNLGEWQEPIGNSPLMFNPAGTLIATYDQREGMSNTLDLWSAIDGHFVRAIELGDALTSPPVFSPDGKFLTGVVNDKIHTWSTATGQEMPAPPISEAGMQIAYSPDGKNLLVAAPHSKNYNGVSAEMHFTLWNLADQKPDLDEIVGNVYLEDMPFQIYFSPDGSEFYLSADRFQAFNARTGKLVLYYPSDQGRVHTADILGAAVSRDDYVAVKLFDGDRQKNSIEILDTRLWEWIGNLDYINSDLIAFIPGTTILAVNNCFDDRLIANGCAVPSVLFYDFIQQRPVGQIQIDTKSIIVSPDGKLLVLENANSQIQFFGVVSSSPASSQPAGSIVQTVTVTPIPTPWSEPVETPEPVENPTATETPAPTPAPVINASFVQKCLVEKSSLPRDGSVRGMLVLSSQYNPRPASPEVDLWDPKTQSSQFFYPQGWKAGVFYDEPQISLDDSYLAYLSHTLTPRGTAHYTLNLTSGVNQRQTIPAWQDAWWDFNWITRDRMLIDSYSRQDGDPLGSRILFDPLSAQSQKLLPSFTDLMPGDGSMGHASAFVEYSPNPGMMIYMNSNYEYVLWDNLLGKSLWKSERNFGSFYSAWSPDGSQAFYFFTDPLGELHLVDRNGQDRQLTHLDNVYPGMAIYIDYLPAWSPDSRWIAFLYAAVDKTSDIYLSGFNSPYEDYHLAVVDTQTGVITDYCLPIGGNFIWSPDSRQLITGWHNSYALVDLASASAYPINFQNDLDVVGWVNWK